MTDSRHEPEAMLDPANPRAAELASALERGDVDKMSFAFSVAKDGSSKRSDGVRELRELNLYEVSVVTGLPDTWRQPAPKQRPTTTTPEGAPF